MFVSVVSILLVIGLSLFAFTWINYRSEIGKAYGRVDSFQSKVVDTKCGQMEYIDKGEGYPVLVIHGIFGGFDQGLMVGKGQVGEGFRLIAPSRFGYLGTSMPDEPTPAKQADAFACLLDSLNIDKVSVVSTSAGSTSAVQFALRHPDRASSLIFISPNAPSEIKVGLPPKPVANIVFRSDYIFWLMTKYLGSTVESMIGVPEDFEVTPDQRKEIDKTVRTVLPVNPRADGGIFDMYTSNQAINEYSLENVSVPSLIIGAKDDPLAKYSNTKAMAERIPKSKLVTIEDGGHMLLGHSEEVEEEIQTFIKNNAEYQIDEI